MISDYKFCNDNSDNKNSNQFDMKNGNKNNKMVEIQKNE